MPELKYEKGKISPNHFSKLIRCILLNAGGGIQRGEIIEQFDGLERRYYAHPPMNVKLQSLQSPYLLPVFCDRQVKEL